MKYTVVRAAHRNAIGPVFIIDRLLRFLSGCLTSKRRPRAVTRVKVSTVLGDQSRHILSFRLNMSLIKARTSGRVTRRNCSSADRKYRGFR